MRRVEGAITARLERVVQEVVEVRRKAQTLSDELELVRAERSVLEATLAEERAALAAARLELEVERTKALEHRPPVAPEPSTLVVEEILPAVEPETIPEWGTTAKVTVSVPATEMTTPRLPSPRNLLDKLKFGRNKGKQEEVGAAMPAVTALPEDELSTEPDSSKEAEVIPEVVTFTPVAPLELEEQSAEPEVEQPAPSVKKPRTAKPKKAAPLPRFAPREFLASLPGLDDDQLDLAAFGIAQLDDEGAIVALNQQGAVLLSADKNQALDQTLFVALLPDANIATRFTEGVVAGKLDAVLLLADQGLIVQLFRHTKSRTNWALLRKQEGEEA